MRHYQKIVFIAVFLILGSHVKIFAAASDISPLSLNVSIKREFKIGERHRFSVEAQSGTALEIVAEKKGVDIGLTAFAPNNEKITISSAPSGFTGRESLFFIAEKSGTYIIEVSSRRPGNSVGEYSIVLKTQRDAKEPDAEHAAAMKLLGEAREILYGSENRLRKVAEALKKLEAARVSFEKLNDSQNLANTIFHIAYITGNEYGRDREAAAIYEKALQIWQTLDDDAGKAICLTQAAAEYRGSGETEKSLAYFKQAIALNEKLNDKAGKGVTLSFFCRLYNDTQNFQKGFEACREALAISQNFDPLTEYYAYAMLANLYANTGDRTNAFKYNQISLEKILPFREYLNPIRVVAVQAAIGNFLYGEKRFDEAIKVYQDALAASEAVQRPIFSASFLTELGSIYYDLGQFEKALEYVEKASAIFLKVDARRHSSVLNLLGKIRAALGQKEAARKAFLEAIAVFRANKDRYAEADTLYNLARLEIDDGNFDAAQQYIQSAINGSEVIRADLLGRNSRSAYLAILKSYYELEIELFVKLNDKNPSANFSERAWQQHEKIRARSLLENFLENGLNLNNFAPPEFYAAERRMLEAIAAAESKLAEAEKAKNIAAQEQAKIDLQQLLENYQAMHEDVRRKNPQFSAVNQLKDFTFADAQKFLDGETAFVVYSLGKTESYAWLIRQNSTKLFKLPNGKTINQTARDFYSSLTVRDSKNLDSWNEKSKSLSRQILQPLAADTHDIKRLIVISDGSLQLVPFAALTLAPDAEFQPLATNFEIVYAPSFSSLVYLHENKSRRQTQPNQLLKIFADPIFQSDDERLAKNKTTKTTPLTEESAKLTQTLRDFGVERLPRLPFSHIEAVEISKFAPQQTVVLTGANASRQKFLSDDFNSYKILHFATHGFLNQRNPDLSGLVLSLYDENRQSQNGFLRVIDLYSMRLNTDLVVLSACQTGLGKEVDGEGIVGLTQGFMFAGAGSVVSSLWKVEDAATAELMKRFYRAMLKENQTPAAALRTAQNELRQISRWRNPNNWAGFVLNGDWR